MYANSSSWCSLEATRFYFLFLFIYFIYFYILFLTNIRRKVILLVAQVTGAFLLLFGRHNVIYYHENISLGPFCARLNSVYLCPELLCVIFSKWDHLCPRYLGVIFSPEWDHLCPRDLGKMFFTQVGLSVPEIFRGDFFTQLSGTICARDI